MLKPPISKAPLSPAPSARAPLPRISPPRSSTAPPPCWATSPRPGRGPRPHRLEAPPSRHVGAPSPSRAHRANRAPSESWGPSPGGSWAKTDRVRHAAGKYRPWSVFERSGWLAMARSFETSRRRELVSWSHHREVAALEPAEPAGSRRARKFARHSATRASARAANLGWGRAGGEGRDRAPRPCGDRGGGPGCASAKPRIPGQTGFSLRACPARAPFAAALWPAQAPEGRRLRTARRGAGTGAGGPHGGRSRPRILVPWDLARAVALLSHRA